MRKPKAFAAGKNETRLFEFFEYSPDRLRVRADRVGEGLELCRVRRSEDRENLLGGGVQSSETTPMKPK
jgi:hypothetical protein